MLLYSTLLLVLCGALYGATETVYDLYTGEPASDELVAYFESAGIKDTCTMEIAECDPKEHRRVDGSCNSLTNPAEGTFFTPVYRLLPADYFNGSYPKKSIDGSELELPKIIRNILLLEGKAVNLWFTQAVSAYAAIMFGDVASIHDFVQFLQNKTDCCTEKGMKSRGCSPVMVPEDDPLHRYTGIRCLNLTTPLVYSDFGCTNDTEPSPVQQATATFDMSFVYDPLNNGDEAIRSYEGGRLTVDVDDDGIIWPPNGNGFCAMNQPGETRCFGNHPTGLLQAMLNSIWFLRQHNYIADGLAAVNPGWTDEMLFQTARDINIAFFTQVGYYEWAKALIGKHNLVRAGVLGHHDGHRDVYESCYPEVSLEFAYLLRWFHTIQEGSAHMYDSDGNFLRNFPLVNGTFRPGLLGVDKNIVKFTQHLFRQRCAGMSDRAVDPDMAHNGVAYLQRSVDVTASDLYKSRLLGFPSYIHYVERCTGHKVKSFNDLCRHIEPERIELLKQIYEHVEDIDFLAGVWLEKPVPGGSIPATLACIIIEFLNKAMRCDRHWYESPNRPYAFNNAQLAEIRKSTLAQIMCNVADEVSAVQPRAFLAISHDNPLTPCRDIPKLDFNAWADETTGASTGAHSPKHKSHQSRRPLRKKSNRPRAYYH